MGTYHGRALRRGRCSEAGRPYLVTACTRHRHPLFRDWRLGRLVVGALREAVSQGRAEMLAWVVMPDHLHCLLVPVAEPLEHVVRRIKSNSARAVNHRLGRAGALWQNGYHERALRRADDLHAAARYIIANPLRAGLVECVGDYPLWDTVFL